MMAGAARPVSGTILRGAKATAGGFVVRFGARILFLYVAARLFGAALFGAYALAVAAVELAVAIGGLGAKRLLFKRLEEENERPAGHVLIDSAAMVAAVSLALGGGFVLAGALWPGPVGWGLILLGPMIAGQALIDLMLAATRWTQAIRWEVACRSLVEPYVGVAAALAAWQLGYRESGLLLSYCAGTLVALGVAIFGARRCLGGFRLRSHRLRGGRFRLLLRDSAGATANDALNAFFGRADLYLVGLFLGPAPAGIYGMARQIRTPVRQVRQSFDSLLNPAIARMLAAHGPAATGAATASAARLILAVQLPILIVLALAGAPLLDWFGPGFSAGYWALLLLAAAEAIQGAFGVSDLIILYRHPLSSLKITGANILFNLLSGWLLIGALGVTGAGLSVLVGVAAGAALRRATLQRRFGVRAPVLHSAGAVAAAALAVAAALGLHVAAAAWPPALATGAAVAVGLLVYAGGLKLWLAMSGSDLSLKAFEVDQAAPETRS